MTDYWASDDLYCWPKTSTLRNKLNIIDLVKLQAIEGDAIRARADIGLPTGHFSLTHYRACHRWLFSDLYNWAGQYRTVRLAKGQSVFCFPEHIKTQMQTLFHDLKASGYLKQKSRLEFVTRAAGFWSELNAIHPFRECDGRTQTLFLANMALAGGWYLDLTRLEPAPTIAAMIASFKAGSGKPLEALIDSLIRL